MEYVIALNNKTYNNVIAENYLCVPAVLETVLKSDSITKIDKYYIANYFGVVLPPNLEYSQVHNFSHSDDSKQLGIRLQYDSINKFFQELRIPLQENYIKINTIELDFLSDYIYSVLCSGKHVICGYEYHTLYDSSEEYAGHVSIIYNVDINQDVIYLLDPGPKNPGIKKVPAYDLYCAIVKANDGLWIISGA